MTAWADAWSVSATAATRSTSGQRLGIAEPERLPILDTGTFLATVSDKRA